MSVSACVGDKECFKGIWVEVYITSYLSSLQRGPKTYFNDNRMPQTIYLEQSHSEIMAACKSSCFSLIVNILVI